MNREELFEKAHTPTDDIAKRIRSGEDHDGGWVECSCQRQTQGEPSDAQLRAAVNAWHRTEGTERVDWYDNPINRERMRAALRAAFTVGEGGAR